MTSRNMSPGIPAPRNPWMRRGTRSPIRLGLVVVALAILFILVNLGTASAAAPVVFPKVIELPAGFRPEGVATGRGSSFFVGSLADGAVYAGNLRTGEGAILVPGQEGRVAVGMKVDPRTNYLFVAGGPTGIARVYDAATGGEIAASTLTTESSFVNDLAITRDAAYYTDSFRPVLYRLPLGRGGSVDGTAAAQEIPVSGDFEFVPGAFNLNGIAATANGKWLLAVSSTLGALYRIDPATGEGTAIDLGGQSLPAGDGILLQGRTLYVVQNMLNQIAVVRLSPDLLSGEVVSTITDPAFRVPTTIAAFGNSLYAVNARFDTPPTPDTEYEVVRVPRA
jgi:sugar lactone lactonase YvrE